MTTQLSTRSGLTLSVRAASEADEAALAAAPLRIAFQHIPDLEVEAD